MTNTENRASTETQGAYKRDQVISIINSVIDKVRNVKGGGDDIIYRELVTLKEVIDSLREQLGTIQTSDIRMTAIPKATDELDAIVATTEQATNTILESCEKIQTLASGAPANAIEAEIMRIFEACSFQDITGQRVTKVIKALKDIDQKVYQLLTILEGRLAELPGGAPIISATDAYPDDENSLMHGPQLPGQGISQEEIDKLLDSF
jgi:chemotaxis protein CheZ